MTWPPQPRASADVPLAELAGFGPYFSVAVHDPQSRIPAPWLPLSALTGSPLVLRDRIAGVRAALAAAAGRPIEAVEFRVAASVTQLGLAARLISPALGAAVSSGLVLRADSATARWQPAVLSGAFPFSLPAASGTLAPSRGGPAEDEALARELAAHLVNGPIRAITEMTAAMSVPPAVLWGNVASAINGAASMIATARPALTAQARAISSALLRQAPLAGTCDGEPTSSFRRRSCCLIYRIASVSGAAFCGDCILLGRGCRPGRSSPPGSCEGKATVLGPSQ